MYSIKFYSTQHLRLLQASTVLYLYALYHIRCIYVGHLLHHSLRMIERCPVNTNYLVNFLGSGEDIRAIDGCSPFVDIDELQLTGGDDVVFMQLGQ